MKELCGSVKEDAARPGPALIEFSGSPPCKGKRSFQASRKPCVDRGTRVSASLLLFVVRGTGDRTRVGGNSVAC